MSQLPFKAPLPGAVMGAGMALTIALYWVTLRLLKAAGVSL